MPFPSNSQYKRYDTRFSGKHGRKRNYQHECKHLSNYKASSPRRKCPKYSKASVCGQCGFELEGSARRSGQNSHHSESTSINQNQGCSSQGDELVESFECCGLNLGLSAKHVLLGLSLENLLRLKIISDGKKLYIPGFYYDKEKKRYFKIAPNHSINSVTRDSITRKEAEIQRKKDEKQLLESPRIREKRLHMKNLTALLRDRNCVNQNLQQLKDAFLVSNITQLKPSSSQPLFNLGHQDVYCNLEHMQQMYLGSNHDEVLGLWSLRDTWVQRIQLLHIKEKPKAMGDSSICVNATPHHKVIIQSLNKVTDLCWAPMTGNVDKQTVLYTTICHTGYLYSLAMIRSLNSDDENERPIFLDYNLGKKATWTCAWNYHRQQFSVGSEKSALMLNIERRTMWDYNTNNSDPLSQTFSNQTGNYFHTGTRKGHILTFDLRSRSSYPISTLVHKSSVGSLVLLQDDVSLLSSDFSGRICLWDLRKRDTVVEYRGNINQYTKLPVHVDETEHVIYTVGEDGYTRFWNLKQGTLLHTIPPPCAVSRETIPSVQYSTRWGDKQGNAGLIMGLKNKVHYYGKLQLG